MNRRFVLRSDEVPRVELRTIGSTDLKHLRIWKNENRHAFFFKGIISKSDQEKWFEEYLDRPDDQMYIVVAESMDIGCIGLRRIDNTVDIYNVILAQKKFGGKGYMSQALRILCSYALDRYGEAPSLKVLRGNPALEWYMRNKFKELSGFEDHLELGLDLKRFARCRVRELEGLGKSEPAEKTNAWPG